MSEGRKDDSQKPDLSLVPMVLLIAAARAFEFGAKKYGRHNFHKGMQTSRIVAACLRHITAYNEGEDLDPESGTSHLGHAAACLAMILKCEELGTLVDNRAKPCSCITTQTKDFETHQVDSACTIHGRNHA